MKAFPMCAQCGREYANPGNRRFHAQPDACPECGPEVRLLSCDFKLLARKDPALCRTIDLLKSGSIVANKGIGGYQLCCDAFSMPAVNSLRFRKERPSKAFAIMVPDVASVKKMCLLNVQEEALLVSAARPIVLLQKRNDVPGKIHRMMEAVAPGNAYLGVMLPYTPLHFLLFFHPETTQRHPQTALIMTSGNRRDEPICRDEEDVRQKLEGIADYFLVHNRPIYNRCDDSISQTLAAKPYSPMIIRRSRGIVPEPVVCAIPERTPSVFAAGAELKNTFCLTRENNAYLSPYIGDLDNLDSLEFFKESFRRYKHYLNVEPKIIAYDLHPDYLSTVFAKAYAAHAGVATVPVQHHCAHIASVLAEKRLNGPVIGFAFDGTGWGGDGTIWGGECFLVCGSTFTRLAHFEQFPLPGGDVAVREIWRLAVSLLSKARIHSLPRAIKKQYHWQEIQSMISKNMNSPLCSSVGRVFDGIAAMIGLKNEVGFEAQAAMELEALAVKTLEKMDKPFKKGYNFHIKPCLNPGQDQMPLTIPLAEIVRGIWEDSCKGVDPGIISLKFHETLAEITRELSSIFSKKYRIERIALSGGVFQNRLLLSLIINKLEAQGLSVYYNQTVPPNDGGIALGQAWIAARIAGAGKNNRLEK
jgi:hydrogenase maturation protein HypF